MRNKYGFHLALLTIAGVAAATLSQTAMAADTETYSRSVGVADLNLASPQGEATLHRRLLLAARDVCGASGAPGQPTYDEMAACRTDALRGALRTAARVVAAARQSSSVADAARRRAAQG